MPKFYISSISIEGFRGINNDGNPLLIRLKEDGVTSFFGENGMGKSSIFEAFLFSIFGRIVRFDDYHGDIKDRGTIKNIFHQGDGIIGIEFIDDSTNRYDFKITIDANGVRRVTSTTTLNPDLFLSSLCSNHNFLDYKSFEKIMLTSAEETGKLFSNLVGFGNFNDIRDKLDKISRTQNINNDFGKTNKESAIKVNSLRMEDLKAEVLLKLKECGIELGLFNYDSAVKYVRSFLKKEYSITLKTITDKAQVDFDQLIKSKIGASYESNVS